MCFRDVRCPLCCTRSSTLLCAKVPILACGCCTALPDFGLSSPSISFTRVDFP